MHGKGPDKTVTTNWRIVCLMGVLQSKTARRSLYLRYYPHPSFDNINSDCYEETREGGDSVLARYGPYGPNSIGKVYKALKPLVGCV